MEIGGLEKFTLIDFPEKFACTVFLVGCNLRCPWCHNPELVLPFKTKDQPRISERYFFDFLKLKTGALEGVVVCGGEPTIYENLPGFIKKIKNMGYLVKLDTNGSNPEMLEELVSKKMLDYVAMDIKAPRKKYKELVGREINIYDIEESLRLLKKAGLDYEFRTTLVPGLLEKRDILDIAKWIGPAKKYVLQNFRPGKTVDSSLRSLKPFSQEYLLDIKKAIEPLFDECKVV